MIGKVLSTVPKIVSLVLALAGITAFMMYSEIIGRSLQSVLHLETDPGYTGGRVCSVLYDPVGDDTGFGSLTYPTHASFAPGSLDIVRYTVHEPVYQARWVSEAEYWQLSLSFAAGTGAVRNIRVYIDADGEASGSLLPRDKMAEGVAFDPAVPWDYGIAVNPGEAVFFSADGTMSFPVAATEQDGGKRVVIRIPLRDRRLHSLYTEEKTRHYVYVGAWTLWARDGFAPVAKRASSGSGGGAPSAFTPKIYDILVPGGVDQTALLSAWNDEELTVPVLQPVEIGMGAPKSAFGSSSVALSPRARARAAELKLQIETEASTARELSEASYAAVSARYGADSSGADRALILEYALAAFSAQKDGEAEAAFDRLLSGEPSDALALAYKGSLVAMRGGEASPLAAVEIIADAYRYMDRAVDLASAPDQIIAARLNRANVSRAIPETVFGKARQGAEDFLAAAAAFSGIGADSADIAQAWFDAAVCLEIAGAHEEAGTWFREASRMVEAARKNEGIHVPAALELSLLERGYGGE